MQHIRGLSIPRSLSEAAASEPLALIVYDMQVGIVSQLADGAEVVARVAEVLDLARRAGLRIFFSRYISLPVEVAGVAQLRTAMDWQHLDRVEEVVAPFPPDAPQSQIVPELARRTEPVVERITMSAFAGTYLDIALRDCGIRTFLIAGIALEVGIEPTVRHATDLGTVGSDRGALPGLLLVGFPGPPAAPGVRLSPHRALHVSCQLVSRWRRLPGPVSTGSGSCCRGSGSG